MDVSNYETLPAGRFPAASAQARKLCAIASQVRKFSPIEPLKAPSQYVTKPSSTASTQVSNSAEMPDWDATVSDPLFTPFEKNFPETQLGEVVVSGCWQLGQQLGRGGFGSVYAATDLRSGEPCAVKVGSGDADDLDNEFDTYRHLWNVTVPPVGIPRIVAMGVVGGNNALVLERLGSSFEELRRQSGGTLPLNMVLLFGIQAVQRLRTVHERGIVHRDVKPHNFMLGANDSSMVYLADFGLAKPFVNLETGAHISLRVDRQGLVGTPIFASIATHMGMALSRRDDLESLGYVIIYMHYGALPWDNAFDENDHITYRRMEQIKKETSLSILCAGMPHEILEYMRYVKQMGFIEDPDYEYLIALLWQAWDYWCDSERQPGEGRAMSASTSEAEDRSLMDSDPEVQGDEAIGTR